jgi:hypothetical protein
VSARRATWFREGRSAAAGAGEAADRFATAKEFAEALQDPRYSLPISVTAATPTGAVTSGTASVSKPRRNALSLAPWAVAAAAIAVAAWGLTRGPSEGESPPPTQFLLTLPDSISFRGAVADIALSRDGSRIALVVNVRGRAASQSDR